MNNSTCRTECLNYISMIKSTDNKEIRKELIDRIDWTIDSQLSKIEHDIEDLKYSIKCKNEDIEVYKWLLNEIKEMKSEVQE